MSVMKIQRIEICALKKCRKGLLEALQRKGVVEVTDFKDSSNGLSRVETSKMRNVFEKNVQSLKQALEIIDRYTGLHSKTSSLKGKSSVSISNYYKFINEVDEVERVAHRVIALEREIVEKKAEFVRLETQVESLVPWEGFDVSMRINGTKSTSIFIGTIPEEFSLESLLTSIAQKAPEIKNVHLEIVSSSKEQTCLFLICTKSDTEKMDALLKSMGFSRPSVLTGLSPMEKIDNLKDSMGKINSEIKVREKEIKSYVGIRNATKFMIDYYSIRKDKYKIIDLMGNTKKTFFIYGFIPQENADDIKAYIEANFDAYVNIYDVKENEQTPVLLKNNNFAAPAETVLESYSLPGKKEIDPTFIMSIFYYILFGLMLSDAAYGIIMTLGCAFAIKKYKNMEDGLKKSLKLFMYCGISTTFWGFIFGSFFGDAVEVVAKTFWGSNLSLKPLWFAPLDNPMKMLMFSLGLGIIHIFAGLFIQFYQLYKQKRYKDAVYDVVFWIMLVAGAIVYLLSMEEFSNMMSLGFVLPAVLGNIAVISALVGALGILMTAGRESKGIFKRFLKGLYGLYNVTGYLSDILSYARLLALGLATGVIANVFNKMGSIAGGGIVGAILFIVIFVLGHTLNIGINLLGAYVHTNRLQFVEFFGKFYEGGGKKFSPFKVKTKYYKIQEEISNG